MAVLSAVQGFFDNYGGELLNLKILDLLTIGRQYLPSAMIGRYNNIYIFIFFNTFLIFFGNLQIFT